MYKALICFSGKISMTKGQIKEIKDKNLIEDLLKAGYIEPLEEKKVSKEPKIKK